MPDDHHPNEPTSLDDEGFVDPPGHVSALRLFDVLARIPDDVLATCPGELAEQERARRQAMKAPGS